MDLIDREYVLEALSGFNDTEHGDIKFLSGIRSATEIVENAPSTDKWISVKDRLPKEAGTAVLVYAKSERVKGSVFMAFRGYGNLQWHFCSNGNPISKWTITHWQPLPEKPKKGLRKID